MSELSEPLGNGFFLRSQIALVNGMVLPTNYKKLVIFFVCLL